MDRGCRPPRTPRGAIRRIAERAQVRVYRTLPNAANGCSRGRWGKKYEHFANKVAAELSAHTPGRYTRGRSAGGLAAIGGQVGIMAAEWSNNSLSARAGGSAADSPVAITDPEDRLTLAQASWLASHAAAAADELGVTGEIRVRVVGDAAMAAAHERFAGVPGTTDVLTFDLREPADKTADRAGRRAMDVDIYACVDEARRQAAARGHAPECELLLYIVHGVLHCLGHDDHNDAAYRRMHAEEDRVLAAIGVGPVFGVPAPHGPGDGGGH